MSVLDRIGSGNQSSSATRPPSERRVYTLESLVAKEFEPLEGAFCDYVFTPQSVATVIGDFGIGKTWFGTWLAFCIATGTKFGHLETRQRPILYLSQEMSDREMHFRVKQMFSPQQMSNAGASLHIEFGEVIKVNEPDGMEKLRSLVAEYAIGGGIFIDSMRDIHSSNENDNNEMSVVLRGIRDEIAKPYDCFCVLQHHTSKPSEFRKGAHRGRGAIVLMDVCADILVIEKQNDARNVTFEKTRHGQPPEPFSYSISEDDRRNVTLEIGLAEGTGEELGNVRKLYEWMLSYDGLIDRDTIQKAFSWSKRTAIRHISDGLSVGLVLRAQNEYGGRGNKAFYEPKK